MVLEAQKVVLPIYPNGTPKKHNRTQQNETKSVQVSPELSLTCMHVSTGYCTQPASTVVMSVQQPNMLKSGSTQTTAHWSREHTPDCFRTQRHQLRFISTSSLSAIAPLEASSSPFQHTAHRGHLKYAPSSHLYTAEVLRPHRVLKAFRSPCTRWSILDFTCCQHGSSISNGWSILQ